MLKPATLLSSARTVPRFFLVKEKYCCSVRVACTHAYLSVRFCPVKSISALPLRNSVILSEVRACTFSMRIRIHPASVADSGFQDHRLLETDCVSGSSRIGQLWWLRQEGTGV